MKEKIVEKLNDVDGEIEIWKKRPVQIRTVKLKEKVAIKTREGTLYGEAGDFLIEGIKGEVYPIGEEIFYKTYDKVQENEKEEIVLAQVFKKDGKISIRHSKSAGQFEVFGFLTCYIEALGVELINGFEPSDEFELF